MADDIFHDTRRSPVGESGNSVQANGTAVNPHQIGIAFRDGQSQRARFDGQPGIGAAGDDFALRIIGNEDRPALNGNQILQREELDHAGDMFARDYGVYS